MIVILSLKGSMRHENECGVLHVMGIFLMWVKYELAFNIDDGEDSTYEAQLC